MKETLLVVEGNGEAREITVDEAVARGAGISSVGYILYDEWADRVSSGYSTAESRALAAGRPAEATYYLLKRQEHEAQVAKQKSRYNGP